MTPGQLRAKVVLERLRWIRRSVLAIQGLPQDGFFGIDKGVAMG